MEGEVKALCEAALAVARDVVASTARLHEALSAALQREERLEGAALQDRLAATEVPQSLRAFVLQGTRPAAAA